MSRWMIMNVKLSCRYAKLNPARTDGQAFGVLVIVLCESADFTPAIEFKVLRTLFVLRVKFIAIYKPRFLLIKNNRVHNLQNRVLCQTQPVGYLLALSPFPARNLTYRQDEHIP